MEDLNEQIMKRFNILKSKYKKDSKLVDDIDEMVNEVLEMIYKNNNDKYKDLFENMEEMEVLE
jgi:hypothetical protein